MNHRTVVQSKSPTIRPGIIVWMDCKEYVPKKVSLCLLKIELKRDFFVSFLVKIWLSWSSLRGNYDFRRSFLVV